MTGSRPVPRPSARLRKRRQARQWAAAVGLTLAALATTGACSPFRSTDAAAPAAVTDDQPQHHAVEDNTYPVTVEHRYGDTLLTEPPDRIVTLGFHDQDTLISLDLRPVGIREWPAVGRGYADWPWAPEDVRPDSAPVVSPYDEIDFEVVASLQPDLITAVHSNLSEADYRHLTEIAPTIAQPPDTDNFQSSWQEETRLMAAAIGRPQQAERVIDDLEATFAAVREEHPVLSDADIALVEYGTDGGLHLVNPYDPRARLFAALGMRFPDSVADAVGEAESDVETDLAALARLTDLDAIVWLADPAATAAQAAAGAAAITGSAGFADLDAVRRGGSVVLTDPQAIAFGSGPSLAHAAERNGKALADALGAKAAVDREEVKPGALAEAESSGRLPKITRTPKADPSPEPTATATATSRPRLILPTDDVTATPTDEPATADPSGTDPSGADPSGTDRAEGATVTEQTAPPAGRAHRQRSSSITG